MAEIYFDFTSSTDGDGTVATQASGAGSVGAYNTLNGKTPASGDTWWLRRTEDFGFDPNKQYWFEETNTSYSIRFSTDGSKMYICRSDSLIYQYTLSTAWDASTATYDNKTLNPEGTANYGFDLSVDGTKLYAVDDGGNQLRQHTLSTPWDISTATYDGVNKSTTVSNPLRVFFKPDGAKYYILSGTDAIYPYTLTTPWDISTATYDGVATSLTSFDSDMKGLYISPDGSTMVTSGDTNDSLYVFSLSTPWDVSTYTLTKTVPVGYIATTLYDLTFDSTGSYVYTLSSRYTQRLELSTPHTFGDIDMVTAKMTVNVDNFNMIGWPLSTDDKYDDRPSSGISSGWDADTAEHAKFRFTTSTYYIHLDGTASNCVFSRIAPTSIGSSYYLIYTNTNTKRCIFDNVRLFKGFSGTGNTAFEMHGRNHSLRNSIIYGGYDSTSIGGIIELIDTEYNTLTNLEIWTGDAGNFSSSAISGVIIFDTSSNNKLYDINVTVYDKNAKLNNVITFYDNSDNNEVYNIIADSTGCDLGYGFTIQSSTDNIIRNVEFIGGFNRLNTSSCSDNTITGISGCNGSDTSAIIYLNGTRNVVNIDGVSNANTGDVIYVSGTDNTIVVKDVFGVGDLIDVNSNNNVIYALNYGIIGLWHGETVNGVIDSSTVTRTGGSDYSLRCEQTSETSNGENFPILGRENAEILWLSLTSGTTSVTVYGAHRLFTNDLKYGDFELEAEYIENDVKGVVRGYMVESDSSVWVGDTDLVPFKCTFDITVQTDQVVPLRINGKYIYESGSYLYIDPTPELV